MFVYAIPLKDTFPTVSENTLEIAADCRKIVTLWHGNAFHITGPLQGESVSQHSTPSPLKKTSNSDYDVVYVVRQITIIIWRHTCEGFPYRLYCMLVHSTNKTLALRRKKCYSPTIVMGGVQTSILNVTRRRWVPFTNGQRCTKRFHVTMFLCNGAVQVGCRVNETLTCLNVLMPIATGT